MTNHNNHNNDGSNKKSMSEPSSSSGSQGARDQYLGNRDNLDPNATRSRTLGGMFNLMRWWMPKTATTSGEENIAKKVWLTSLPKDPGQEDVVETQVNSDLDERKSINGIESIDGTETLCGTETSSVNFDVVSFADIEDNVSMADTEAVDTPEGRMDSTVEEIRRLASSWMHLAPTGGSTNVELLDHYFVLRPTGVTYIVGFKAGYSSRGGMPPPLKVFRTSSGSAPDGDGHTLAEETRECLEKGPELLQRLGSDYVTVQDCLNLDPDYTVASTHNERRTGICYGTHGSSLGESGKKALAFDVDYICPSSWSLRGRMTLWRNSNQVREHGGRYSNVTITMGKNMAGPRSMSVNGFISADMFFEMLERKRQSDEGGPQSSDGNRIVFQEDRGGLTLGDSPALKLLCEVPVPPQ